jgi:hypothetical protein
VESFAIPVEFGVERASHRRRVEQSKKSTLIGQRQFDIDARGNQLE